MKKLLCCLSVVVFWGACAFGAAQKGPVWSFSSVAVSGGSDSLRVSMDLQLSGSSVPSQHAVVYSVYLQSDTVVFPLRKVSVYGKGLFSRKGSVNASGDEGERELWLRGGNSINIDYNECVIREPWMDGFSMFISVFDWSRFGGRRFVESKPIGYFSCGEVPSAPDFRWEMLPPESNPISKTVRLTMPVVFDGKSSTFDSSKQDSDSLLAFQERLSILCKHGIRTQNSCLTCLVPPSGSSRVVESLARQRAGSFSSYLRSKGYLKSGNSKALLGRENWEGLMETISLSSFQDDSVLLDIFELRGGQDAAWKRLAKERSYVLDWLMKSRYPSLTRMEYSFNVNLPVVDVRFSEADSFRKDLYAHFPELLTPADFQVLWERRTGDPNGVLDVLYTAHREYPSDEGISYDLAMTLMDMGAGSRCVRPLRALDPDTERSIYALARWHFVCGRYVECRRHLDRLIGMSKDKRYMILFEQVRDYALWSENRYGWNSSVLK